jgi:RES domain-containing protein
MTAQLPTIALDASVYCFGGERLEPGDLVTAASGNRWNGPGEPVVYLAGDIAVAVVEAGRHIGEDGQEEVRMSAWRVPVRLEDIVDLRNPSVRSALKLEEPYWFLDQARCRTVGRQLRKAGPRGFLAPSAGFPDDPERWNLVLFDVDEASLAELAERARVVGRLVILGV